VVQLGMFKTGRVLAGAAVAALALTSLNLGTAQAVVAPVLPMGAPTTCSAVADSPTAGQTTITDTTLPTVTSVLWSHTTYTAKSGAVARVTVKTTDDCAGAGNVAIDLRNSSSGATATFQPTGYAQSLTATSYNQTWTFDIPLHGTDAGSIYVKEVERVNAFTTYTYPTAEPDTDSPVVSPDPDSVTADDYTPVAPATTTKTVVKIATSLVANATPEPAHVGHSVTIKATLRKLRTSTYVADASQYVTLQYHLPGSKTWHSIKKVKTSSIGVATTTFKVTRKGTYGFRAVYSGATYAAAVSSSSDAVSVR